MELADCKIIEFINKVKSKDATPGGGAVAALTAAEGIALIIMVTNFTINNKKYEEFEKLNQLAKNEAEQLLMEFLTDIDTDKKAFEKVSDAYAMPKNTENEKIVRKNAIANASVGAAEVPLSVMHAGLRALELADMLIGKTNSNLVSDLYVAVFNLYAAIESAKLNVQANIPYISDKKCAFHLKKESEEISKTSYVIVKQMIDGNVR